MKNKICLLVAIFLLFFACKEDSKDIKNQTNNSGKSTNSEKVDIKLADTFYKKMIGKINEKYPITMHLTKRDSTLSGFYFYHNKGIPISIYGTIDAKGKIEMTEYTSDQEEGAKFYGKLTEKDGLKGFWKNKKSRFPFSLTEEKKPIISLKLSRHEEKDCSKREKNMDKTEDEYFSFTDTMCSSAVLDYIEVDTKNAVIAKKMNTTILKFLSDSKSNEPTMDDYFKSFRQNLEDEEFGFYDSQSSLQVITNDFGIISFESSVYLYLGGAHGSTGVSYLNFDLKTGELIDSKEILKTDFLDKFAPIAEKKFEKEYGEEGWFYTKGEFPMNDNFAITTKGLLFVFNQYELGPYAAGIQSLFFSFKELEPYLIKNSVLNRINN